ncbi:MAG: alpha/beta hydrolase [Bacteroidota bacterium]
MKISLWLFLLMTSYVTTLGQKKTTLYLIAGHGSDHRVFQNMDFGEYDTVVIPFLVPIPKETMADYAARMATRIDTTQPFALVGVSIGGMVATEIAELTQPQALVLIASAKGRQDLPKRYRFQRAIPLYKLFSGQMLKRMTIIVQPWFEPGVKDYRQLCRDMVMDKPPKLTKRGIGMIINWARNTPPQAVPTLHIHGPKDSTLPLRHIEGATVLPEASHMMALFKGKEVSQLMLPFLEKYCE